MGMIPDNRFKPFLEKYCKEYEINTPLRLAAFIAQIAHESGDFKYTREIWGPTKAQIGYEGRLDLGNTVPGDGKRYLGRGLIQITGRNNYVKLSKKLGVDFVNNPELLEQPEYAVLSACSFWQDKSLNTLADAADFKTITRRINGGLNGYDDRLRRYKELLA